MRRDRPMERGLQRMPGKLGLLHAPLVLCIALLAIGCDRSAPVTEKIASSDAAEAIEEELPPAGGSTLEQPQGMVSGESQAERPVDEAAAETDGASSATTQAPEGPTGALAEPSPEADVGGRLEVGELVKIEPVLSDDPQVMIRHLDKIDEELRDLVLAGSRNLLEKDQFMAAGRRLGMMKLRAGEHLANLASASEEQRKKGVLAQLVALSHLSGLGDVESARKLEQLADHLQDVADPDLAHQSQVVLLGFELQAIQNGQRDDVSRLLELSKKLFQRQQDRGFAEFMLLQQIISVLEQLDYRDEADQVRQTVVDNYLTSNDPQLRGEAWLTLTRDSQELLNFTQAYNQALAGDITDPGALLASARVLIDAFPHGPTLEHLTKAMSQLEYAGQVDASRQLAELVETHLAQVSETISREIVTDLIAAHRKRIGLLGQPMQVDGLLVDLDGQPVQGDQFSGKITIVDVWATWCIPCLREIPNLRKIYDKHHQDGVQIIGISVDARDDDVRSFVTRQQIPWVIYRPADGKGLQSEFAQRFGIKLIPFVALVDRGGRVVALHARGEQLEDLVRQLLEQETEEAVEESQPQSD